MVAEETREGGGGVRGEGGGADAFGRAVAARRAGLGLSLDEVASRAGCAKSYLWAVERGRKGPPSEGLIGRLEAALEMDAGSLGSLARWERTPGPVRRDIAAMRAAMREKERSGSRLAGLLAERVRCGGGASLDQLYKSGELAGLIEALSPQAVTMQSVARALPLEIPLINKVTAGYPADFTDLGYPARVADEYVRAPDLQDPDAFAARVVGDSMEPDYRAGDIVVFSPAVEVRSGMDCFVRLEPDHESTFKRVFFEGEPGAEMIRITPLNGKYEARTVERERVAGLYAGVSVTRAIGG
jgi:SOS-response transcriptional repressor LexA